MVPGRRLSAEEARIWAATGQLPSWYSQAKQPKKKDEPKEDKAPKPWVPLRGFVGIDGEGQTDPLSKRHKYTLLAAADEDGKSIFVTNPRGLSTDDCLQFITAFGPRQKLFAYSFGYDITKILQDVDDLNLHRLFRPEERKRFNPKSGLTMSVPVYWPADAPRYSLNYLNGRISVRNRKGFKDGKYLFGPSIVINDIWKFFQGKFTAALEDWKVPDNVSEEERARVLAHMRDMKDKRSQFDRMNEQEVLSYCLAECRFMARLARKLTDAHIQAEIPLKSYFGAGSSATAMLTKMGIREHVAESREIPIPKELHAAIMCAFFGGRFENSYVGPIDGPIWAYDISSAYPYYITFLPCLIHGKWTRTRDRWRVERARAGLVYYRLHVPSKKQPWAPFPFRFGKGKEEGSIAFPESGSSGWLWKDEFFAGEALFPNAQFVEGWAYECECDCQPFSGIPQYYIFRLRIGKEGPGIVIKLAINSTYGKTAQFIGGEPGKFTSFMWAGMTTSGCRAQCLRAMAKCSDLRNLLMIATDGIASRERLALDIPRNTGTEHALNDKGKLANKPLGGWEEKLVGFSGKGEPTEEDIRGAKGLFLARPGIYFPMNPTKEELEKVRARGIGRGVVYEQWRMIVDAFERGEKKVHVKDLSRFIGAKTAITKSGKAPNWKYTRSRDYGQWINRPVDMSFSPLPKREKALEDGSLLLRRVDGESAPYKKGILSKEAVELIRQADEEAEQPDGGDLSEGHWEYS
jgi:hypothetical protein